jgi:hypothetical protein
MTPRFSFNTDLTSSVNAPLDDIDIYLERPWQNSYTHERGWIQIKDDEKVIRIQ